MIRRLGPVLIQTERRLSNIQRPLLDIGLYPHGDHFADQEPTTVELTFAVGDRGGDPILALDVSFAIPLTLAESYWQTP